MILGIFYGAGSGTRTQKFHVKQSIILIISPLRVHFYVHLHHKTTKEEIPGILRDLP